MKKIGVILVVLNKQVLEQSLQILNYEKFFPVVIIMDDGDGQFVAIGEQKIPCIGFGNMQQALAQGRNFLWLICGFLFGVSDIYQTKKFLVMNGVPEDNVVNFVILFHITQSWVANVHYAEKNEIDSFATGISYVEVGMDFDRMPELNGVNLASSNQDLRQGLQTAKYIFENSPGKIKFVFIGLNPYSLRYDNVESFSVCPRNLQYLWTLKNFSDETTHGKLLGELINKNFVNQIANTPAEFAEPNYERIRPARNWNFSAHQFVRWNEELENLTKTFRPETFEKNVQILEEYIKLCLAKGAKPIGVCFPFAKMMHDNYDQNLLTVFRHTLRQFEKIYDFTFIDLFDLPTDYSWFYNMSHLNLKGSRLSSSVLSLRLHEKNILPVENLCQMTYEFFNDVSHLIPPDEYNSLTKKVFSLTAEKLRAKDKLKIGFVSDNAAMWCGDRLYNYFLQDERFEPTVFICLDPRSKDYDTVVRDFRHGIDQFQSRGINVFGVEDWEADVPTQDVLIFLRPYLEYLPKKFQLSELTAETLSTYIPYGMDCSTWDTSDLPLLRCAWQVFFDTQYAVERHQQSSPLGMPQAKFSGCPKTDVFLDENETFHYDWKMTRPDAKKIIYAPHWSIEGGIRWATFQWNYQFMYEYAASHPEISWVMKPHPHLLESAVLFGLFPSVEEFEKYLDKWNALPNAKVETGAYYQEIFATSDGMILDSSSFIAEYQYTHKPLIFLTRDTNKFNDLAVELMKNIYCVDGKDLQGIADLMQKIFIDGNDELFDRRREFFDKYFNYKKINGMFAGEYIYKSISG